MNSNNELIKKYFENHPATAALASKYGLKEEFIVIDVFSDDSKGEPRLVLNQECFDKFIKSYEFSYGEDGKAMLHEAKENGDTMDIAAALMWMDKNYSRAIDYHSEEIIKNYSKIKFDYTTLPNIINKIINECSFLPRVISSSEIKKVANKLKDKYKNIIWNDNEYDIYVKLVQMNKHENRFYNTGLIHSIFDTSIDILELLKTIKSIKGFYKNLNLDNRQKDKLLNDVLEKVYDDHLEALYDRLCNENKLNEVISSPDKYYFSNEIKEYHNKVNKKDEEVHLPSVEVIDSTLTNNGFPKKNRVENIIDIDVFESLVDNEIVRDVEDNLAKYGNIDKDNAIERIDLLRKILEALFTSGKAIYNTNSLSYDREKIVASIEHVLEKNDIRITRVTIEFELYDVEKNIRPIPVDLNTIDIYHVDNVTVDQEIIDDLKDIEIGLSKNEVLDADGRERILLIVIKELLDTKKSIYDPNSSEFNHDSLVGSLYTKLKEYGFSYDEIDNFVKDNMVSTTDIDNDIDDNVNTEEIYNIFNVLPEKEVKENLTRVFEADNNTAKYILKEFSKFINASMYGTLRDISKIESQFTSFCGANGINYTDEFINSLPEIIRDKYKNPVVKKEQTERRKGETFKIVKRYIPKTSVKTQKRLYASLAGLGIMSFLFMTVVKVMSPDNAAESCIDTFEKLLHSELLAKIFGDVKTYFASIAASMGGIVGVVAKDEDEKSKSK